MAKNQGKKLSKSSKKGNYKRMRMKTKYNGSLLIKRTVKAYDGDITGEQGLAFQFNLSALPNVGEFTNLFDRYKITGVKLRIMFLANSNDTGVTSALSIPLIHYINDLDDAAPPTSENEILQKNFLKTRRLDEPFTYFLKPKATSEVYASPSSTGYSVAKSMWIDGNSPNIPHFGFKAWIGNGPATPSQQNLGRLKVYATYYVALKDPQ